MHKEASDASDTWPMFLVVIVCAVTVGLVAQAQELRRHQQEGDVSGVSKRRQARPARPRGCAVHYA